MNHTCLGLLPVAIEVFTSVNLLTEVTGRVIKCQPVETEAFLELESSCHIVLMIWS